jgi:uncharacterized membrane protein YedE/YeeE
MTFWPFWIGGGALFLVALLHWLVAGQLMSVSSRFSAIVDRLRGRGGSPEPMTSHASFFGGIVLGGAISTIAAGTFEPTLLDVGVRFDQIVGDDPVVHAVVVTLGGVLVGFGTRMATGCTSGHGLCGVARLQRGSLLATVAFFGTGVLTSFLLSAVAS